MRAAVFCGCVCALGWIGCRADAPEPRLDAAVRALADAGGHDAARPQPTAADASRAPERCDDADGGAPDMQLATHAPAPDPALAGDAHRYFAIRVLDSASRSPLMAAKLETTNHIIYGSDRDGVVAFYEPGLMDQDVFFSATAEGYQLAADGFGIRGKALHVTEGGSAELMLDKSGDAGMPSADDAATLLLAHDVLVGSACCAIRVHDAETQRGVPLVFVHIGAEAYVTDSQGMVAYCDPAQLGKTVKLSLTSHGYQTRTLGDPQRLAAGATLDLELTRSNIARRLYRSTGEGIDRDSVLLGLQTPLEHPLLNAFVMGQDTVDAVPYRGSLFWIWGDTNRASYALGNFRTTGARSKLPDGGGLDPRLGVNYDYFVGSDGFARAMIEPIEPTSQPTWLGSMLTLPDAAGEERLFALYSKPKSDLSLTERGLVRFDDDSQTFTRVGVTYPLVDFVAPDGQPVIVQHDDGAYVYFGSPLRVPARAEALMSLDSYEVWSALGANGSSELQRTADGAPDYAYRHAALATTPQQLMAAGISRDQALDGHVQDDAAGKPIALAGSGALSWNEYRKRFVRVVQQQGGDSSFIGELWYVEGDTPLGPWVFGRKIVSHDDYTFYNPWLHPYFARRGGAVIQFEATYTRSFASDDVIATPRYDYNQIMYELDLDDPRVISPVPVYDRGDAGLLVKQALKPTHDKLAPAFFALDRARTDVQAVYWSGPACASRELRIGAAPSTPPLFYAVPAGAASHPPNQVPLYSFHDANGAHRYGLADPAPPGFQRDASPLAYVWPAPIRVPLPVADFLGDVVADAGADQCLQPGARVSVDASATRNLTGEALEYTWREGEGCALAHGQKVTLQLGAGLHTIWLEVSDGRGHVSRDSVLVAIGS